MSCANRRRRKAVRRSVYIFYVALVVLGPAVLARAADFSIGANFTGSTELIGNDLGSNSLPAMPMGAAGPNQLVEFTSSTFATYTKTGAVLQRVGHKQFWQTALAASGANTPIVLPSSTHVLYDSYSYR